MIPHYSVPPAPRSFGWRHVAMIVLGLACAVAFAVVSILAYRLFNPQPQLPPAAAATPVAVESIPEIDASDLVALFKQRPWAAEEHWQWKTIDVTGLVDRVEVAPSGTVLVHLAAGRGVGGFQCGFVGPHAAKGRAAKRGQLVKIRGGCVGLTTSGFVVSDCERLDPLP